jgi:hypothetical protein
MNTKKTHCLISQERLADLLDQAIHALKIDVPILHYELKHNRLILHLYGRGVVTYPHKPRGPA